MEEGLTLERDPSELSGFAGVRARGPSGHERYTATIVVSCGRNKEKRRVLGNSFSCAEVAALRIARGKRDVAAGRMLPF